MERASPRGGGGGAGAIWDAATGQRLATLGQPEGVEALAFSEDGTRLITIGILEEGARVWDAVSGALLATLGTRVRAAGFAPGGGAVTQGEDGVQLWSNDFHSALKLEGDIDVSVAFTDDGQRVVTAGLGEIARIWSTTTGAVVATIRLETASGMMDSAAFSRDGTRVVTTGFDATARVWDAASGAQQVTLDGHSESISSAAFSPDGALVVTASADGTARVWDAATGRELDSLEHPDGVNQARFSPDGHWIVTTAGGFAQLWDVHLETRAPAEIAAIASAKLPWEIVDGRLVRRP